MHSVIPQRWRFLRQLLLTACPRKPQQYSVYARLENPFLAWAWRRKAWGSLLKNLEASRHERKFIFLAICADGLSYCCLLLFVTFLACLPLSPNACLTLSLSAYLQLEGLAIIHNTFQVDRRRPAKDNGTGCGKRLLLCQKKVNLKYVRFESKSTQPDERNTRAKDVRLNAAPVWLESRAFSIGRP